MTQAWDKEKNLIEPMTSRALTISRTPAGIELAIVKAKNIRKCLVKRGQADSYVDYC